MKKMIIAALIAASACAPFAVLAEEKAAAAAKVHYSTAASTINELLENPTTKAIVVKHLPEVFANEQIEQAGGMTLRAIQAYAADQISDEKLAKIDEELKAVPAPKP